jgi:predicted DNA-binding WGR domain protein
MIDLTWRNTAGRAVKYYRMDIVQGLFGDWSLVHEWGKFGEEGQSRMDWFQTEAEAKDARFVIHMEKAMAGYE